MGCTPSRPPPYNDRVRYASKKQLRGALRILCGPPTDAALWKIAFSITAVAIATAHRKRPRHADVAIEYAGIVAIFAAAAAAELSDGPIISIAAFVR